jgi:hypothetical protein
LLKLDLGLVIKRVAGQVINTGAGDWPVPRTGMSPRFPLMWRSPDGQGTDILFIGLDPVGRNRFLGLLERQLARADEIVKPTLKLIFHMGVLRLGHAGLGPQVADGVGTTELEAYQVVNFILTELMRRIP